MISPARYGVMTIVILLSLLDKHLLFCKATWLLKPSLWQPWVRKPGGVFGLELSCGHLEKRYRFPWAALQCIFYLPWSEGRELTSLYGDELFSSRN